MCHGNIDGILFIISVKRGKGGCTITDTVRIVMSTYPMDIPLFSLYPVTVGFLLSYDKGDVIGEKLY